MSLGFWIFLSTGLVCTLVSILFAWKFPDFKRKIIFGGAALVVVIVAGGFSLWGYEKWQSRPKPLMEFAGIPIEATRSDALFLLGKPQEVVGEKGRAWKYERKDYSGAAVKSVLILFFDEDKVAAVLEFGEGHYSNGIRGGSDYGSLVSRLGSPDLVIPDEDQTRRELVYRDLNSIFIVREGIVQAVGMLHPKYRSIDEIARRAVK